jgi:hypothetical protein
MAESLHNAANDIETETDMPDAFSGHHAALDAPASHGFAVTPNDATDLAVVTRALYVGTGGSIAATMLSGETVTFAHVPDGAILPVRLLRVRATGTTALDIVGLN